MSSPAWPDQLLAQVDRWSRRGVAVAAGLAVTTQPARRAATVGSLERATSGRRRAAGSTPTRAARAILPSALEAAMTQETATKPTVITSAPFHPSLAVK